MNPFSKRLALLIITVACTCFLQAQTAKYAGGMKNIIGKKYSDNKHIPGLSGWQFKEGSVVSDLNDPKSTIVEVFSKGKNYIIFFSVGEDSISKLYTINDLIEVKNVTKVQQVKTALCREFKKEDVFIVALTTAAQGPYSKALKAWRLSRQRNQFEIINAKNVDCINEAAGE